MQSGINDETRSQAALAARGGAGIVTDTAHRQAIYDPFETGRVRADGTPIPGGGLLHATSTGSANPGMVAGPPLAVETDPARRAARYQRAVLAGDPKAAL